MKEAYKDLHGISMLKEAMSNCEQTKGLSVYEHGVSVARYFSDLCGYIRHEQPSNYEWRLPEWINSDFLWDQLMPINDVFDYQIYHDCGKPFCRTVDNEGKVHFPEHAKVSGQVWRHITGHESIARLIELDMEIHTIKAVNVPEFADRKEAATLLITGLAEVHSNASMFGGIESSSFKAKWKQIDRRGKAIMRHWQEKQITV